MASALPPEMVSVELPLARVPRHVAIIMDGNGRWARCRGLPRAAGHKAGVDALHGVVRAAADFQIKTLTVYAFSTENWQRPNIEVKALLSLLEYCIDNDLDNLHANGVRIRHVGRKEGLSSRLVRKIARAEKQTEGNTRLVLNIAFNYGGRAEIVDAVRQIVTEGLAPEEIDEKCLSHHLAMAEQADPDLIVRTGGEMRLSNFMLWEAAYAEFYSTPTLWPDFDRNELYKALLAYQGRERRFGGLGEDEQ